MRYLDIAIRHLILLVATVLCVLCAAPPARAQGPSDSDRETARQLMDQGSASYRDSKYQAALEAFEAADKLVHVTTTGLAVAKTLVQLGRLVQARGKLLAVARIEVRPDEPPPLTRARQEAEQLQKQIAARIGSLVVSIKGPQSTGGLAVTLDGQAIPSETLKLPRRVDPGTHRLEATAPGYQRQQLEVSVEEGEQKQLTLQMVRSSEDAAPPGSGEQPAGDEGWVIAAWIGFGVAAGATIVGAVTGGLSLGAASDAKDQCVEGLCPRAAESDADRSLTLAHVSTISFVVAALGAGLGVTSLFMIGGNDDSGDDAKQGTTAHLVLGPGFAGFAGEF